MDWRIYWNIILRRWLIILAIVSVAIVASGYLYAKAKRSAGYQACTTLYVADVSSPSLISAPSTTLETAGQLLAGETAANFFADDILDVAQSRKVASYVAQKLHPKNLPNSTSSDIEGAVSGTRRDRTVDLCVTNPQSVSALAAADVLGNALTTGRAAFIGGRMAQRTYVGVISPATVGPVATSHQVVNFALRVILGLIVSLGIALLWDALDPTVRNEEDLERATGVPVLSTMK